MMEVTLRFRLLEEVTPAIFAERVAQACGNYGALRPGEAVILETEMTWTVEPLFDRERNGHDRL